MGYLFIEPTLLSYMRAFAIAATRGREELVQMLFLKGQEWKTVPPGIRQMTRIQTLDLSDNQLTALPDWLGELEQLDTLILSRNPGLPSNLFIPWLPSLQTLELRELRWEELPTSLFQLTRLSTLDISANALKQLDPKLGQLTQLKHLIASENVLKTLPKAIGDLSQLRSLRLGNNELTKLPGALGQCQHLDHLGLSDNRLGALPRSIGQLAQLSELVASKNRLSRLPASIGDCRMLRRLQLSGNRLSKIPSTLRRLQWLSELHLSQNNIKLWPAVIEDCPRLVNVNLSYNRLSSLPDLSACKSLETLNLTKNRLTTMKACPPALKKLQLDRNQLTSVEKIGALKNLSFLSFSNNKISDIPSTFWHFPSLKALEGQRNPVQLEAEELLHCHALERIEGLLSKSKKAHLLAFMKMLRAEGQAVDLAIPFYDLYSKKKTAWEALTPDMAWQGLQSKNPYFANQFRKYFYKKAKAKTRLKKGMILAFLGTTTIPKNELKARLDVQGLVYHEGWSATATHLILANPPFTESPPSADLPYFSETQLIRYLDRLEGRSLSAEKSEEKIASLRQLLLHGSVVNCRLALQLMEGGGVPASLLTDGVYLYLSDRFPLLKEKLERLFFPYLPAVSRTVLRQGMLFPNNYLSKRDWENGLGTKEIDGDRLLQLFKSSS